MKKWQRVGDAQTPDGRTLSLFEHDGDYSLRIDGAELMSTRQHASEEHLAELLCARVAARERPRMLIGGLGFGFSLKAALRSLPANAEVVVAELMAAVISWNKDPHLPLAATALADPRTRVVHDDVGRVISGSAGRFDAILLDVDNGPANMVTASNDALYDKHGLYQIQAALRPKGVVGFWSAAPDKRFEKTLGQAGFATETERVKARLHKGGWHTLYIGQRV